MENWKGMLRCILALYSEHHFELALDGTTVNRFSSTNPMWRRPWQHFWWWRLIKFCSCIGKAVWRWAGWTRCSKVSCRHWSTWNWSKYILDKQSWKHSFGWTGSFYSTITVTNNFVAVELQVEEIVIADFCRVTTCPNPRILFEVCFIARYRTRRRHHQTPCRTTFVRAHLIFHSVRRYQNS